jgi:hypothetical protein
LASEAKEYRERNPLPGLATGTTGAISELVVATDLLRRGYSVFRSLSPACKCDLAILKGSILCRVEVKTGYLTRAGAHTTGNTNRQQRNIDFDVLAIVLKVGTTIVYEPDVETWFAEKNGN